MDFIEKPPNCHYKVVNDANLECKRDMLDNFDVIKGMMVSKGKNVW